jgi:hypothetical protein
MRHDRDRCLGQVRALANDDVRQLSRQVAYLVPGIDPIGARAAIPVRAKRSDLPAITHRQSNFGVSALGDCFAAFAMTER